MDSTQGPSGTVQKPARSKRDRFLDVAERRTDAVLRRLQLLGRCANRSVYQYGPDDVEKVFGEIQRTLDRIKAKFEEDKPIRFKLR